MPSVTDYDFLTTSQQKMMLLIYQQKEIAFETQHIFKNKSWFRNEMAKLIRFDKVELHNGLCVENMNRKIERYVLTFTGKLYVEKYIIDYNKAIK